MVLPCLYSSKELNERLQTGQIQKLYQIDRNYTII